MTGSRQSRGSMRKSKVLAQRNVVEVAPVDASEEDNGNWSEPVYTYQSRKKSVDAKGAAKQPLMLISDQASSQQSLQQLCQLGDKQYQAARSRDQKSIQRRIEQIKQLENEKIKLEEKREEIKRLESIS